MLRIRDNSLQKKALLNLKAFLNLQSYLSSTVGAKVTLFQPDDEVVGKTLLLPSKEQKTAFPEPMFCLAG